VLRITAAKNAPDGERKYWREERTYGQFERRFSLPEAVNPEGIEAELDDGVLHLTLVKKPEAQPKKIAVRQAKT
jgi:HSP20 family protein